MLCWTAAAGAALPGEVAAGVPVADPDPALLEVDTVEVVVQVNGKIRDRLQVAPGVKESELVALARASERVGEYLNGEPARTVVVPDKLVNFVT